MPFGNEDEAPRPPKGHMMGEDLSSLSVHELEARIALMQREIERLEQEIAAKSAQKAAADLIFGGGRPR